MIGGEHMISNNTNNYQYNLDKLYNDRLKYLAVLDKTGKRYLHNIINTEKQLQNEIAKIININLREHICLYLQKLEGQLQQDTTYYNKKLYKQGFSDGVNLLLDCRKKI